MPLCRRSSSREELAYLVWIEAFRTGTLPEQCSWAGNYKCNFNFHVASLLPFPPSLKTSYFLSLKELLPSFLFLSLSVKFSVSGHGSCVISLYHFSLLCTIYLAFSSLPSLLVLHTWYHSMLMFTSSHWPLYNDPNLTQRFNITNLCSKMEAAIKEM